MGRRNQQGGRRGWPRGLWVAALACFVGGSTLTLGVGLAQSESGETIVSGVQVDGLELGGKTREEAGPLLQDLADRKLQTPVRFYSGKYAAGTSVRRLGGRCDPDAALAEALALGRSESWMARLRDRVQASVGYRLSLPVTFEPPRLAAELKRLAQPVERNPVEPRARLQGGKILASGGAAGRLLDDAATSSRLSAALADADWCAELAASVRDGVSLAAWTGRARALQLNLVLREAVPRVTVAAVGDADTLLASFTTSFSRRDRNRVHNIRLAAQAIDGRFLLPGDEFSYNETVGPRRRRHGFRTAPEIVRGELVPGIGGGVCQVSSTLYNAALLADLEITRRHHHRFPVSYVAAGRDATVSDSGLDLRLRNRLDGPVALLAAVEGRQVHVRVYGPARCKRAVRLVTRRLRPAFTKRGGRRVALDRIVEEKGRAPRRETISYDSYEPAPPSLGRTRQPRHRG